MDLIFDLLATHETYFFREEHQLMAFQQEIIPELIDMQKQSRMLRIWCAGCSSGEEPYTVAILCRQQSDLRDWDVQILATDISQKMIAVSKRAIYGGGSFRSTSEAIKHRYFEKTGKHRYTIREDIRQMVTFMKLNLLEENPTQIPPEFDVIFCRNVIIYFDPDAKNRIIETFYKHLRSGGYLLLGHSESLMGYNTPFILRHLKNDVVYQK
jgi:chemotaxis protein methyltransferase CheR